MGALKLLRFENKISTIHQELSLAKFLGEKKLSLIETFCAEQGIYTLADITAEDIISFYSYVKVQPFLSENQREKYPSALETAVRLFNETTYEILKTACDSSMLPEAQVRKAFIFLSINHINCLDEITADLRVRYVEFLTATGSKKMNEYVKVLDHLKVIGIKEAYVGLKKPTFDYKPELIFLAYHPNPTIAETYEYTQKKEPLFFDFSLSASDTLKRQVFAMLKFFVEAREEISTHYRIQQCITPLWNFYNYCVMCGVEDINRLTKWEVDGFMDYLKSLPQKNFLVASQIVGTIRRYTFVNAPAINWDANVWYLERFKISEERINPANPIDTISFDDITIAENASLLKTYMRYLIGLAPSYSMQSARSTYYYAKQFLIYCDECGILLSSLKKEHLENYMQLILKKDIKPSSHNSAISGVAQFIEFLETKELIAPVLFLFEYYRAKTTYLHKDISVPEDDMQKILSLLGEFPEDLRLMMLNLWCIGLRINEVCAIKGNAYSFDGENAWFLIYQNKAKREKRIPIPYELYVLMREYISKNGIGKDDYVFKSSKCGQPYKEGTFRKKVKAILDAHGINFRSHGFRHTVATDLYMNGCNIQAIREYLGHLSEEMTKHYIDHLPNAIDKLNEQYFASKGNWQDE